MDNSSEMNPDFLSRYVKAHCAIMESIMAGTLSEDQLGLIEFAVYYRVDELKTAIDLVGDQLLDLRRLLQNSDPDPNTPFSVVTEENEKPNSPCDLDASVSDLNLTIRSRKALHRIGIYTLADLVKKTADDLLDARNFGTSSLEAIRTKLAKRGLKLKDD